MQERGDPEGRRLAVRRAAQLAEAGRLLRALEIVLQRSNFDTTACIDISRDVAKQEQIELLRGHGRIESRKRFKHRSSQPLLARRQPVLLFIDENGLSHPQPHKQRDTFSLSAVAMSENNVQLYKQAADQLKRQFLGRTDVTFHEPWMRRHEGPFYFAGDSSKQAAFCKALDDLVRSSHFTAFGVGIRKTAFGEAFVKTGINPYLPTDVYAVAIAILLERFLDFLASSPDDLVGRVTFESQGPREDATHQLEYARTLVDGTQWVAATHFQHWLEPGKRFVPKSGSDPIELADMLSRDVYEWVDSDCLFEPRRWKLFCERFYWRDDGQMGKCGIKVFPDSDVRERIEAHRSVVGSRRN